VSHSSALFFLGPSPSFPPYLPSRFPSVVDPYREVVAGILHGSISVAAPAVLVQESLVLPLLRKPVCAEKQPGEE